MILDHLLRRPVWMNRASCAENPRFDQDLTVPEQLIICAGCSVRAECLEMGLAEECEQKPKGLVWGGLSPWEMWEMRPPKVSR